MTDRPLARLWRRVPVPLQLVVFGVATYAVGLASVAWFRPAGTSLAVWWPAAGIGLVAALIATPRQRPWTIAVHLVATVAINLTGGQALGDALQLGAANAAEVVIAIAVLRRGRDDPRRMHEPGDLARLVLATLLASGFVGLAAGLVVHGADARPVLATFRSLAPSHLSALLLFSILPLRGTPSRSEASRLEVVAQWLLVTLATVAVFAPGQRAALVFLVLPTLLWAALRSGVRAVGVQLITAAAIAATMTLRGGGPFAPDPSGPVTQVAASVTVVQLFVVSVAIVMTSTYLVVQARREAAAEVDLRDRRTRLVQEHGLTGVLDLELADDGAGLHITGANRIAAGFLGAGATDLVGQRWCDRFVLEDREQLRRGVGALLAGELPAWHGELHSVVDGADRWFDVALFHTPFAAGRPQLTGQMLDVTARRATELRLSDLALRDDLTGAANRPLLRDRLDLALATAARDGHLVGLLYLDLDRFKPINDRFGHAAGDQVLVEVARRLGEHVRAADTVARLGGDEFAVLLPDVADDAEVDAAADRLHAALAAPFELGDVTVTVGASIGIATAAAGDDPRDLLRRADRAMYARKAYARTG